MAVGLSIVGVPYGVVIGIVTGIGNLIPYVGAFVAYVCTIASCLLAGDIRMLIIATVMICIFQFIDGNIINPKLLSDSVEVHPLLVICCLLIGGAFGGVIGTRGQCFVTKKDPAPTAPGFSFHRNLFLVKLPRKF